jgi:hypothetical protein
MSLSGRELDLERRPIPEKKQERNKERLHRATYMRCGDSSVARSPTTSHAVQCLRHSKLRGESYRASLDTDFGRRLDHHTSISSSLRRRIISSIRSRIDDQMLKTTRHGIGRFRDGGLPRYSTLYSYSCTIARCSVAHAAQQATSKIKERGGIIARLLQQLQE